MGKGVLHRQQRPEGMGFAWLRGFHGTSIRSVVPRIFTMSWHTLEAGRYVSSLNLGGCLEGCMDGSLAGLFLTF